MKQIIRNKFVWILILIVMIIGINVFQANRKNEVIIAPKTIKTKDLHAIENKKMAEVENRREEQTKELMVDLKGEIKSPGVYRLEVGDRVYDAIKLAGGFVKQADQNQVNLAQKLVDEMIIYVPKIGEVSSTSNLNSSVNNLEKEDGIDVNHATMEELQKIPGIGPSKAKNIAEYIETNGPFTSVEQLDEVNGIGSKSLEQMRPFIIIR